MRGVVNGDPVGERLDPRVGKRSKLLLEDLIFVRNIEIHGVHAQIVRAMNFSFFVASDLVISESLSVAELVVNRLGDLVAFTCLLQIAGSTGVVELV